MSGTWLEAALAGLPVVTLEELEASAALLTRRDRKYLVPRADAARFVDALAPTCRVLEIDGRRAFRYESTYFDTPGLGSYLDAAHKRPRRFKVRTRSYLDSGLCQLEIKTRDPRGRTVKQRVPHPFGRGDRLGESGRLFVADRALVGDTATTLQPVLMTRYTRSTLLLSEGVRVTCDVGLRSVGPGGRTVSLPGIVVVETKSGGVPSAADRILWGLGHRPLKISKFGTSLAALYPALPSNKWTRALRRPWSVSAATPMSASAATEPTMARYLGRS